jgi:hypothetical protein
VSCVSVSIVIFEGANGRLIINKLRLRSRNLRVIRRNGLNICVGRAIWRVPVVPVVLVVPVVPVKPVVRCLLFLDSRRARQESYP